MHRDIGLKMMAPQCSSSPRRLLFYKTPHCSLSLYEHPILTLSCILFFPGVSGAAPWPGISHHLATKSLAANQTVSPPKPRTVGHRGRRGMKTRTHTVFITNVIWTEMRCPLTAAFGKTDLNTAALIHSNHTLYHCSKCQIQEKTDALWFWVRLFHHCYVNC